MIWSIAIAVPAAVAVVPTTTPVANPATKFFLERLTSFLVVQDHPFTLMKSADVDKSTTDK